MGQGLSYSPQAVLSVYVFKQQKQKVVLQFGHPLTKYLQLDPFTPTPLSVASQMASQTGHNRTVGSLKS